VVAVELRMVMNPRVRDGAIVGWQEANCEPLVICHNTGTTETSTILWSSAEQYAAQDQTKTEQRERQTQLTAPVAGVIQQLAIHSVGGVVTSAQPLMVVVPESATVTAEISIANQDIGFVNAGQGGE
jgi:multidrug resistance efflux pump